MNKRFSTLLATLLVAGGLSSSAWAVETYTFDGGPGAVEDGEYTYLYSADANSVLGIDKTTHELIQLDVPAATLTLDKVNAALWKVTVIKATSVAGGNTYKFQNKATGQWLSIDLQSTKDATAGADNVTSDTYVKVGGANSVWAWDKDNGLYAYVSAKDSTYSLTADSKKFKLNAKKGNAPVAGTKVDYNELLKTTLKFDLSATDFNTLTKGKLYFNGDKDVSTGNANILTANTWTAEAKVGGTPTTGFYNLKNAAGKYLVVDTALYTGTTSTSDPAFKLNVDTVYKKSTLPAGVNENAPAAKRTKETYEFKAEYHVAADSIVIFANHAPTYVEMADANNNSHWTADGSAASTEFNGQVILRTLANATVLTIEPTASLSNAYVVKPLIQPTAGNIGGTAEITPNKVYYVADMKTYLADGSAENPYNGKFYDYNLPNQAHFLNAGQAFNVGTQFYVVATPGTDKGNYAIYQRYYNAEPIWEGVADSLADGSIVIARNAVSGLSTSLAVDTIKLVDANIEYKDAVQYATFHASDFALKNKQFKIQSASPLLGSDMFIHMKKDSTLALQDGEVLYSFKRVAVPFAEIDGIEDAIDPLAVEAYEISTKDGQYLIFDGKNYLLTSDPTKYQMKVTYEYKGGDKSETLTYVNTAFVFVPTEAADKYVIMPVFPRVKISGADKNAEERSATLTYSNVSCKVTYNNGTDINHDNLTQGDITVVYSGVIHDQNPGDAKNRMVTVNTNTGDLENRIQGAAKYDLFYVAEEDDPQSLFTMPKHIQIETTNNQFVTVNAKNEALVVAENALKAANYTAEDFTFWLDTAAYTRNGETLVAPSYYVTRGVAADTTTKVDAHRMYMYNAADSAAKATVNKEQYLAYGSTRVIFREAQRYGADSLIVAGDTLTLDGKKTATIAKPKAGVNNFRFNFLQAKDEAEGVYNIKSGDNYLRNLNGVLVIGDAEEAVKVTVNTTEAPTANEANPSVSEVKVIATEGGVQIVGAEGKKVVVSNILGQVIANTVLSSSDATIAAPAGVVVVAIEGEDAVKAIVK